MAVGGFSAVTAMRADGLFFESRYLDVAVDWPRVQANVAEGLSLTGDDPYYMDVAGVIYTRRLHAGGGRDAYERAASLFARARERNPFDPYILVHRIELETIALQNKTNAAASRDVPDAIGIVLGMDPNNATVHQTVATFRLAERRFGDALASIRTAERLRPHQPRSHVIEGDVLRALDDRPGAVTAYRTEADLQQAGSPEWVDAEHRLIVTLAEMGQRRPARDETIRLLQIAPNDSIGRTLLDALQDEGDPAKRP